LTACEVAATYTQHDSVQFVVVYRPEFFQCPRYNDSDYSN